MRRYKMKNKEDLINMKMRQPLNYIKEWVTKSNGTYHEVIVNNKDYSFSIIMKGTKEQIEEYKRTRPKDLKLMELCFWLLERKMKGVVIGENNDIVQKDCDEFNNMMKRVEMLLSSDELLVLCYATHIDEVIKEEEYDEAIEVITECYEYIRNNNL